MSLCKPMQSNSPNIPDESYQKNQDAILIFSTLFPEVLQDFELLSELARIMTLCENLIIYIYISPDG
jgi:hypothetical protein